jgi:Spy/CpxP family protein refolding chaperone
MFGFFIGTACLLGLIAAVSHRRRHHRGFGYGHGGCGRHGFSPLRRVLDRLDTTPGQEKEIRTAVDELMEAARTARQDFRGSREDVARVIREPELPLGAFDSIFQKHDEALAKLREAGVRTVHRIHETLDGRQRDLLASLLESWGPGFFGFRRGF